MGYGVNLLSNVKVKNSTCPNGKAYIYENDGGGLRLRVEPNSKYWLFRGKLGGKEIQLSFGTYPSVGLDEARGLRDISKQQLKQGIHPRDYFNNIKNKNLEKSSDKFMFSTLFEDMVEYRSTMLDKVWSKAHIKRSRGIYKNYLEADLKDKSILTITDSDLLHTLKKIKSNPVKLVSGKKDIQRYNRTTTMNLAKSLINLVYEYASEERAYKGDNPLDKIRKNKVFKKAKSISHKSVDLDDLGMYWSKVQKLPIVQDKIYLIINIVTGLRVGSLSNAKWSWYSPTKKTLSIPKEFMKSSNSFVTPLPNIAVSLLNELKDILKASKDDFIFTNRFGDAYASSRPRLLIKEMGFDATAHGNRTIVKLTCLRHSGFPNVVIEKQLDHEYGSVVERSYMADYDWLDERRNLVDWLLNYLEARKSDYEQIIAIGKSKLELKNGRRKKVSKTI